MKSMKLIRVLLASSVFACVCLPASSQSLQQLHNQQLSNDSGKESRCRRVISNGQYMTNSFTNIAGSTLKYVAFLGGDGTIDTLPLWKSQNFQYPMKNCRGDLKSFRLGSTTDSGFNCNRMGNYQPSTKLLTKTEWAKNGANLIEYTQQTRVDCYSGRRSVLPVESRTYYKFR